MRRTEYGAIANWLGKLIFEARQGKHSTWVALSARSLKSYCESKIRELDEKKKRKKA